MFIHQIVAVAQDLGLFTRQQALADGYEPDQIRDKLRRGLWVRLQRAVYVDGGVEVTPLHRAAAAVLTVATDLNEAVASHHTAARVHGLGPVFGEEPEHVTVRRTGRRPRKPPLVIHNHTLGPDDVTEIGGVPMTSPLRTVIDLLIGGNSVTAVWACEKAMRDRLVDSDELLQQLEWYGSVGKRRALARLSMADVRSESPLETGARLLLATRDLPTPVPQYLVRVDGFARYRLDLAYPDRRLALELDGRQWHSSPEAVRADRIRERRLVALGWRILRFSWDDVFERPDHVVAAIQAALAATPVTTANVSNRCLGNVG
jgi:hypothetical protein